MGLIHDITPGEKPLDKAYQEYEVGKIETDLLVKELWERGIPLKEIFAHYYEREAMADGNRLTVEDATLVFAVDKAEGKPF